MNLGIIEIPIYYAEIDNKIVIDKECMREEFENKLESLK